MANLPLIEIVKRQAILTFSKLSMVSSSFEENLAKLRNVANKVTSTDLNLDNNLLHPIPNGMEDAPVTYIQVMDDPNLTIGIFVLKQGARLPLHDHPLMYGILKVVHGTVHIQSYSMVTETERKEQKKEDILFEVDSMHPEDIALSQETLYRQVTLLARKEQAVVVNETDIACVLSPVTGNLHEIHSVDGPAAFVDILSPPYGTDIPGVGPRPCRYFKEIGDVVFEHDEDKRPVKKLLRIPSPPDYWSSSAPYQGP